jgi:hypothetical protein
MHTVNDGRKKRRMKEGIRKDEELRKEVMGISKE